MLGNHIARHERGDDLRPCHYRPLPLVHLHESGDPLLSGADTTDDKGRSGGCMGVDEQISKEYRPHCEQELRESRWQSGLPRR